MADLVLTAQWVQAFLPGRLATAVRYPSLALVVVPMAANMRTVGEHLWQVTMLTTHLDSSDCKISGDSLPDRLHTHVQSDRIAGIADLGSKEYKPENLYSLLVHLAIVTDPWVQNRLLKFET